jgi:transcriptional regulator with XRE-family HTH domain
MVSPYVRRQQLALAIAEAREAIGLTHTQLASKIGQSRAKISRLENGHIRPAQAEIFKILEVLGVEGEQWARLVDIASDAADKGWWHGYGDDMGPRQAIYADLESGTRHIREFQPFIPGLLQTAEFARQRQLAEAEIGPVTFQTQRAVEARQTRQRMLLRSGGPSYEVVIDEVALRRLPAPPAVVADQIRHVVKLSADPDVAVRILPVDARIRGYAVPRSGFSLYTYPDPLDPRVAAVDTVTTDVVLTSLTEPAQLDRYEALYERLAEASLSVEASTEMLSAAAAKITEEVPT